MAITLISQAKFEAQCEHCYCLAAFLFSDVGWDYPLGRSYITCPGCNKKMQLCNQDESLKQYQVD